MSLLEYIGRVSRSFPEWTESAYKWDRETKQMAYRIKDVLTEYEFLKERMAKQRAVSGVTGSFWMVLGKGTPTVRHLTIEAAKLEAERLSRQCPGERFYVLQAVGSCIKTEVEWTELRDDLPSGEDIPF